MPTFFAYTRASRIWHISSARIVQFRLNYNPFMQKPSPDPSPSSIEAVVQRISYSNEENGFSVVRFRSVEDRDFTAVGPMLGIAVGDRLRLSGIWAEHPKFGEQFKIESFLEILPSTLDGLQVFLGSGRVRGVGPVTAKLLIRTFGLEVLDVIEHQPDRLLEIRGIGPATVEKITASWAKSRGIQRIMVFLAGHGIPPGIAVRLHRRYGESALAVIRENPYRLAEEVYGVGFLTADRIAQKLGIASDAPERLAAGLLHALSQAAQGGHLFLPREVLFSDAQALLDEPEVDLEGIIDALRRSGHVVVRSREGTSDAVFTTRLDRAEETLAVGVARLAGSKVASGKTINAHKQVRWFSDAVNIDLAEEQERSLVTAIERPVTIVTGGPGTGKTTLVKGLVKILGRCGLKILLAAPTGRAAKRLEEASGKQAKTLHRLLEFNPVERVWGRNAENQLEADCVVVDEVSMLDVELGARLVEAVPPGCRLVLVGDADQLPSVGPGDVLADLITSGVVDVIYLQRIYRQGKGSLIAENAHRINRGQMPVYGSPHRLSDFYFAVRSDVGEAATTAVEMAAERIPKRFGLDPLTDIQVLAPMHRGEAGVSRLNERLQEILAPPGGPEVTVGSRVFRHGDKVMQLRNNYELDVFNGDVGRIVSLDVEERELTVDFSGRAIVYQSEDLEDLNVAYACTIHKAQGSEYPAVVVVLHDQHHLMLQRNLLYTAVTRGRRLVVLVGSKRALSRAVRTESVRQRNTMLATRVRKMLVT